MGSLRRMAVLTAVVSLVGSALTGVVGASEEGFPPICDGPSTVGGGMLGTSPGPVGPPSSLGWDVGTGQCNGSFTVAADPLFPGGSLELGLRAEERRVGPITPSGPGDYTVMTGHDTTAPPAFDRAWWGFQGSIAYGGPLSGLDELTMTISTDAGPNVPTFSSVDLLALRPFLDARNSQPNATVGFADLYQFAQNPEFGWFSPPSDTDANPTGDFDYDAPGAWRFTLAATEAGFTSSVSMCVHTPGEMCAPLPVVTPGVATVGEGDAGTVTASVPVSLSAPSGSPVTVQFETTDWTATASDDYVSAAGSVTFAPGEIAKTVPIEIKGDVLYETDELVAVAFSGPVNATLGGIFGLGAAVIVDDDPLPTLTAGVGTANPEGASGTSQFVDVPVTLSAPAGVPVTVDWTTVDNPAEPLIALSGSDYIADSGSLTFLPGETSKDIVVEVLGDDVDEPPLLFGEWGFVSLFDPTNASIGGLFGLGIFVIVDDDV